MAISSYRTVLAGVPSLLPGLCQVPLRWPMAEPDEVLDYSLDIGVLLAEVQDSIASVALSISPSGLGELTASSVSVLGTVITAWLRGGVPGRTYTIRIEATTNAMPPRTFERFVNLTIDPTFQTFPQTAPPSPGYGPPTTWQIAIPAPALDFTDPFNSGLLIFLGQPLTSTVQLAP